jgi:acyl-CoA synthetase (AMP-forming)/AMP-acid ligase II
MNPTTLTEAFRRATQQWSDRSALVFGDQRMTYAQLGTSALALADFYRRLPVGGGDRIVSSLSNRPEYLVALGGAWLCGAVHVGADYRLTAPELSSVVGLTGARVLVYEPPHDAADPLLALRSLRQRHPDIRVIVVGDGSVPPGCLAFADLARPTPQSPIGLGAGPAEPPPDDPALFFITSGTTGRPKATVGYHGNLCQRWQRLAGWLEFGPDDVHLAQLPLAHGFGLMMAVAALLTGGRLVLLPHFRIEEAIRLIRAEGVTVLNGAPAHFKLLLNACKPGHPLRGRLRLSVGTAAAFPPDLVHAIWDKLGVKFMFMYGSSEGVGVATTDPGDILLGSVGRPVPGSVAVVGPDRQPLPPGVVGELAFSRRAFPVQYWGESGERPRGANTDGAGEWYCSGDLGRLDEQGRLYVLGRLKHQIDRGGLKVDPVEVENALLRCRGVADAAVIGAPNPVLGETVCACVVAVPGETPELGPLRTALAADLAPHKLPEQLCILDHIPRTPLGKVDLGKLRAAVAGLPPRAAAQR